ncbi:MAG: hypothetical protein KKB12_00345, partial [Candidatus Omnitrophica bacterium]|nr:hypothetical protein [Candidatus Omnitrophota bacterium]
MQTKKIIGNIVLAMFVFFYVCNSAFGRDVLSNEELLKQISKLRELVEKQGETIEGQSQRIKELEAKHGIVERKIEEHTRKISELAPLDKDISERLKGQLKRLETAGAIEVGAGITFVGQGTPNANAVGSNSNERIKDSRFGASYSADVEIAKAFGNYGFAFVHLETGDGETIEGDLSLYPRCSVNRDADRAGNVVSLTEAWYEQYLFNDQIIITGGKIDPTAYIDVNEFANDETTQFLGSMFRNSPAIEFSDNSIGGRVYMTSVFFPAI